MVVSDFICIFAFNIKGITGKWLNEQVGKNEATVSRWCSNKKQPSLDTLVRISELLDIDIKDLIVSNKA